MLYIERVQLQESELKKDLAKLQRWTQRIPEPQNAVIDPIRLAAANEAYCELCEKLANILIYGPQSSVRPL